MYRFIMHISTGCFDLKEYLIFVLSKNVRPDAHNRLIVIKVVADGRMARPIL